MKCINCGADIPDTDQFCGKCGCKTDNIDSKTKEVRNDTYNKENKEKKNPGYDIMTVMSTTTAFLILTVAASIIFVLVINLTKAKNNNNVNNNVLQGIETESTDVELDDTQPDTYALEEPIQNTESDEQVQTVGTLTIISDVNVRDNPDTDNSNVIKVAKAAETYEYLGLADYGNWYIILLEDGTKGYVYKGYVSTN